MLSDDRIQQVEADARATARALEDEALRQETARVEDERVKLPAGDARDECAIYARIYLLELGRRKLLSATTARPPR
jgi:hypothetical protein